MYQTFQFFREFYILAISVTTPKPEKRRFFIYHIFLVFAQVFVCALSIEIFHILNVL